MKLQGKVAVVTGGGSGIGRAIALTLAREGVRVVVCGRRRRVLGETVELVRSAGGGAESLTADVTSSVEVGELFGKVAKKWQRIDILVNNAGLGGPNPIDDSSDEHWLAVISTNLHGPFYCTRAALRWMPRGGRIVNISSVLGRFGVAGYTAYCSSKHGVIGLTRALALELAPREITVNAICPGWVETAMARQGMESGAESQGISYEEFRRRALGQVPLKEMVQPAEIGEMVCFLSSDGARNITGQTYNVCGGQIMN